MLVVLVLTLFSVYLFNHFYWKRRNLPPGPIPLPIFGNLLSLNFPAPGYVAFERWTKQYGDVYTFWIGSTPFIMISSFDKIKETFIRDPEVFVNKKKQPITDGFRGGEFGIIESNGSLWREHRRFALSTLKEFGLGKNLMQEKILLEVQDFFLKFDASAGKEVDIASIFENGLANVINQLVFGYRFDESRQKEYASLRHIIDTPTKIFEKFEVFVALHIPFVSKLMVLFQKQSDEFRDACFGFFHKQIEEHRAKIDFLDGESSSDFVEVYLKEQRKREENGDFESFSTHQLANVCLDLWFAGLGTSSVTIAWAIIYVLNNYEIQENIHEELDRVIGSDRLITTSDKNDLPYLNAFINETQRCANIVPLNLPHATTKDTVIDGYSIPKGFGVVAQISTVMHDEKTFPAPYKFNPSRFIENGKLKKIDELVPFSVGKRQCLGEGLARLELFLFISNFFNRYQVFSSNDGPPSLSKKCASVLGAPNFLGVVKRRY